jgi:peptide/nickel transport system ATP-binding protein
MSDPTQPTQQPAPLLELAGVQVRFGRTEVLRGLDLVVHPGRHLALTGRSAAGKTTAVRVVLGLQRATSGDVRVDGHDVRPARPARQRWLRSLVQSVAQDASGSLDPRRTVGHAIAEPLVCLTGGSDRAHDARVREVLDLVGLPAAMAQRRSHELSGGQRQRVALARALAVRPRLLVADEALSRLDSTTRLELVRTLAGVLEEQPTTLLLVSHDLDVAEHLCPELAVLDAGRIVEQGPTARLLAEPAHPATAALVDARWQR